jgi:hypothetical protein
MLPTAGRLLLLLLLAVDWAADPSQLAPTVRLLSHSLGSTECFCGSVKSGEEVGKASRLVRRDVVGRRLCEGARRPQALLRTRQLPHDITGTPLVYVFMSIRQ